jgi:hypothetical protein
MAAGVTDRLWDVADLVALSESYEQRKSGVSEYPRLWGWITIASAVPLLLSVVWRGRLTPTSDLLRKLASVSMVVSVLIFLFSFMQWASWYK